MLDLGALKLAINVDSKEAKKELKDMDDIINDNKSKWQKLGTGAQAVGSGIAKGVVAATAAVTAATTALIASAKSTAEYGDNVDKMSQKIGFSREGFQEWDYVLGQNGASIEKMQIGMKTLTSGSAATTDAFGRLGISINDSMSQDAIFDSTVKALQQLPEGVEKSQMAFDLFGKSGADLMPLLNQTAEGTDDLKQRAHDLGLVMSDEAVDASVVFGDTLDDLKGTIGGLSRGFTADLLPSMTTIMTGFTDLMLGSEGATDTMKDGVQSLITELGEKIPIMLEAGIEIVKALIQGLVDALPELIPMGIEMLLNIIEGIVETLPELVEGLVDLINVIITTILDNLDRVIDTGIELVLALVLGIIEALPELIARIPEIISAIVTAIIEHLPELLEAGILIIKALIEGVVKTVPLLIGAIPQMVYDIGDAFINTLPEFLEIGAELVNFLYDGIEKTWDKIGDFIDDKVQAIKDSIRDAFTEFIGLDKSDTKANDSKKPTKHRIGFSDVPYDNYAAILHKGERVLTAGENDRYNKNITENTTTSDTFVFNIKADNIKQLNDLVNIAENARRMKRMGVVTA